MRPEAPAIEINGETIPPIAYTSYLPRSKYYAEVAQCGLHLYSFPAYIAHRGINMLSGIGPFRRGIWTGEDELDFTDIHEDMGKILAADPDARVIMRICLDVPDMVGGETPGRLLSAQRRNHPATVVLLQRMARLRWRRPAQNRRVDRRERIRPPFRRHSRRRRQDGGVVPPLLQRALFRRQSGATRQVQRIFE